LRLGNGSILRRYLLRLFLPVFAGALGFFALILEMIDLFANLWRYLALDVGAGAILRVMLLYLPTCLSYGLPIALLFASAYALGTMESWNELVSVFSGGYPLYAFISPLVVLAALISVGSFFFQDRIVQPSYRQKVEYSNVLLQKNDSGSRSNVAVMARDGRIVYRADYYDDLNNTLQGVSIIIRDNKMKPIAHYEAMQAKWENGHWTLSELRGFELKGSDPKGGDIWAEASMGSYTSPLFDEPPASFRNQNLDPKQMNLKELSEYMAFQKRSGLPTFAGTLAEWHKRYAFSFAPLVVVFLSCALGGRYRKNVLLMSLLSSLLAATGYYIVQMVTMLMARTGLIAPAAGAWTPLAVFALVGVLLFRRART